MKPRTQGAALICLSSVLWGLDGVVFTPRLANLPVALVVLLLHAVPFVLMQPLLASSWRRVLRMDRRGWTALLMVALFGGLVGTMAVVHALFLVEFKQLSVVVLLQKLQPVFAIFLATVLLGERVSLRFLGWTVLALGGAYLMTFGLAPPLIGGDRTTLTAAFWAVVAAASFGAATVLGKQLLASLDFKDATFARYGATTALALVTVLAAGVRPPPGGVTPFNWLIIGIIGVTTGSGAIFFYYRGLRAVSASVATICELWLPLSAVVFDYVFNRSLLAFWQWVGAAVLVGSILRISLTPGEGPEATAEPGRTGAES